MIPQSHPYIKNYLENRDQLGGMGNALRVVVENPAGDIYDANYLDTLREINDELVLMPGVDRAWVKSLWTPVVRWTDRKSTRLKLQSLMRLSYAVFCLKKQHTQTK